jgi:hypothetical protein
MRLPVVVLDGLWNLIEEPLLLSHIVSPSLEPDIVGTVALCNSLEWKSWSDVEWSVDMESEVFVEAFLSIFISFIYIQYIPSLGFASVIRKDLDWVSFHIFTTSDIESLTSLPIDELVVLIFENLPPSWVGAPDLHIVGSSRALDVPRLVVVSGSDGQRLLVEVPSLGSSAIWCLDDHVSIVDQIEVSVVWKLWDNEEISLNIETEFLVQLSLGWFFLVLINIDYSPSLVHLAVLVFDHNVSVLIIKSSWNSYNLSSFVYDEVVLVSE